MSEPQPEYTTTAPGLTVVTPEPKLDRMKAYWLQRRRILYAELRWIEKELNLAPANPERKR